ncbi:hypothetical protein [Amphritea sp. HPY]|uniref:hypothetical protein n=1 Tax=Amphritea sp. HPY TaxID=3421652 RepID=UPI003D7DC986
MSKDKINNRLCSHLTINEVVGIVHDIDNYDPDFYIDDLQDELDASVERNDPDSVIEQLREHLRKETDTYQKAKKLRRKMQNELTDWKHNLRDTLLVTCYEDFHMDEAIDTKTPQLNFNTTTLTRESVYAWFCAGGHNEKELTSDDLRNAASQSETEPELTPKKKPRKLQENTKEAFLMLIALLTEKLYETSQDNQIKTNWVLSGEPNLSKIVASFAPEDFKGLKKGTIINHIREGKSLLKEHDYPSKL